MSMRRFFRLVILACLLALPIAAMACSPIDLTFVPQGAGDGGDGGEEYDGGDSGEYDGGDGAFGDDAGDDGSGQDACYVADVCYPDFDSGDDGPFDYDGSDGFDYDGGDGSFPDDGGGFG
jgi:hypothetical protein